MENNKLLRSTPEEQGVSSTSILAFIEAVETYITKDNDQDLHSFMFLRHGHVISEGWWSPYRHDMPHTLFSLSKSFTSTAIGLAVNEGLLSVEDHVISYFQEEYSKPINDYLAAMQIKHLLTMSTGHVRDTIDPLFNCEDGNWVRAFFDVPLEKNPGTYFLYNSGATYILSVILQKVTGQKLIDFLQPRLFEPLGIENPIWETCPRGFNAGGFGLSITTEDIAKFGQLYLQKGVWEGSQLIPSSWILEATSSHIDNGTDLSNDWNQGYGYQFWRCRHNGYRGDGAFGQFCVILPEEDIIIAITSGLKDMQIPLNLVWDHLLPGIKDQPLPENKEDQSRLKDKLALLKVHMPEGKLNDPCTSNVSGQHYQFEENVYSLTGISVDFGKDQVLITLTENGIVNVMACGLGEWLESYISRDNKKLRIMSTGIWSDEKTFTVYTRTVETPFCHTSILKFKADTLELSAKTNVSFNPIETISLKGIRQ